MLPMGHVAYTLTVLTRLQAQGFALHVDYRGAALAALLPDLIDKPLSLTVMSGAGTSQGWAHTLLGHTLLTIAVMGLKPGWIPYAFIANSHLVADQMWKYPHTLLFPFSGRWDSWKYVGTPGAMLSAYAEIATRPEILAVEAVGLALLGWAVAKGGLHSRRGLGKPILSGRLQTDSGARSLTCA